MNCHGSSGRAAGTRDPGWRSPTRCRGRRRSTRCCRAPAGSARRRRRPRPRARRAPRGRCRSSPANAAARASRARTSRCSVPVRHRDRLLVRRDRPRVAERGEQVAPTGEQPRQLVGTGVVAHGVDHAQRVAVGAQRSGRLHGPQRVGHGPRGAGPPRRTGAPSGRAGRRAGDPLRDLAPRLGPAARPGSSRRAARAPGRAGTGSRPRRARRPRPRAPPRAGRRSASSSPPESASSSSVVNTEPEQGRALERLGASRPAAAGAARHRRGRGCRPAPARRTAGRR